MGWNLTQLSEIEKLTLGHYDANAESYRLGTRDHDVSENYNHFLREFPSSQVLDILDFGCGPGRDVRYFKALGHRPVGIDGSAAFCRMARELTQCEILYQQFLNLSLAPQRFDGIFANASLFHVPSQELPRVLQQLHRALRTGGILFSSNPRGDDECWAGQRYGHYMQIDVSKVYFENAGFEVLHHYYRPEGKPLAQQPWLAIVCRKRIRKTAI